MIKLNFMIESIYLHAIIGEINFIVLHKFVLADLYFVSVFAASSYYLL